VSKRARVVLGARVAMNAIFFATKRVFHSAIRVTRGSLQSVAPGLTAARFDMMFALTCENCDSDKLDPWTLKQSRLWRVLGVTPTVVSRMLRSLEALGWVTRRRPPYGDQRQREVTLTEAGLACIRAAYKRMFRVAGSIVYHAICYGKHRDWDARWKNMDTLESYLRRLREYCRDSAQLYYCWGHPDH
jgi:DNA-binding MarR family transcriptional regulator